MSNRHLITFLIVTIVTLSQCLEVPDDPFALEFSPYVFRAYPLPFKTRSYAQDWFGQDVALIQSPLLAPAKQSKPGKPLKLPVIQPLVVSWRDLDNTHINDENGWNFERRVDSKVWWPNRK